MMGIKRSSSKATRFTRRPFEWYRVYNRANPMTDVIIRNNEVKTGSSLGLDDDQRCKYLYLTNGKNHKWTKPLDKGRYVISK